MNEATKRGMWLSNEDLRTLQLMTAAAMPTLKWRHHGIGVLQGYVKESDKSAEVRVHVWHPSFLVADIGLPYQIHNHRFRLYSRVLLGELRHNQYNLVEDENGSYESYTVVHARAPGASEDVVSTGKRYNVESIDSILWRQGDSYEFARGAYHNSQAKALVVTLVTKLDQSEEQSCLLGTAGQPPKHGMQHTPMHDEAMRRWIEKAAAVLRGEMGGTS